MEITITVDTEKKCFSMNPINAETIKWFLDSFPAYMGAYYGAFISKLNKVGDSKKADDEVTGSCMNFVKSAMAELGRVQSNMMSTKGEIIDVEAKETKKEDFDSRYIMPKMQSRGKSDNEGTA